VRSGFIKIICIAFALVISCTLFGQYTWKLSKEKDGIKVYESPVKNSNYKSIKVECTFEGTYDKLLLILNNVDHFKDWVYNNKTGYVLKQDNPYDYYYYTETYLPWPATNRDAVEHLKIKRDSLNRFLKINADSDPGYIPEKSGKIRVPHSAISWYVTAPATNTINIEYIFEADPGGSLPAWLVNMFADKGPVESFKKLAELLKK
jgi:START domain